jgi:hypothetical protein
LTNKDALEELQNDFWDDVVDGWFGFDIINSSSHPFKQAFELYKEQR